MWQDFESGTSFGPSRILPDHASLFVKGLDQKGSPPWRDDDRDGHYMFALGDNLTSRCNYAQSPLKSFCYILLSAPKHDKI